MLDALSRSFFLALARSSTLQRAMARQGMRGPARFARRFVAGQDVDEAIATARGLEARGLLHTFNYLGEHVRTREAAEGATRAYLQALEAIRLAGLTCSLSVKLTQLGLEIDPHLCHDNLAGILAVADARRCFIRVDMEHAAVVDATLDIALAMRAAGHAHVGVVLQSALRRTPDDLARVLEAGAPVRLVKGAYREPPDVAFPDKADVDRAFAALAETLLDAGNRPAFATHDPRMVASVRRAAEARGLARDRLEFQMLYGVRRDLQAALRAQGYAVRVYLPFGADWFPYFMRRLAERPANALFVLRSLLYEQLGR
ncbi:MAG: proline dehydrogenase family protein [Acidobacteria bacterium]|nr:proline dehydrogenase family protein [Acidobacteriota bacterium]